MNRISEPFQDRQDNDQKRRPIYWDCLISNDDFPHCVRHHLYFITGVSTFDVFDNYTEISNNVDEWKRQRELRGG